MASKKKNLSSRPCPQVQDVLGRPIAKDDFVIYRPGGGAAIRIARVVDIYMTEATSSYMTSFEVKVQLKALALYEISAVAQSTAVRKPKGSTIGVSNYAIYSRGPSRPPQATAQWTSCTLVADPLLLQAATTAIP